MPVFTGNNLNEYLSFSKDWIFVIGHLVRRGIPLLVLGGVLASAYYYLEHGEHAPVHQEGDASPPPPMPVSVVTTQEETVPLRLLGQTELFQVVEIRARVADHILDRTFQEGKHPAADNVVGLVGNDSVWEGEPPVRMRGCSSFN